MSLQWYALQSKPMKEALLWEQLSLHQVESFFPHIRVQPVNPRARKVKPYFPGYIFGHLDLALTGLSTFQWMPGAAGVVSFDGMPAAVPDNLISEIRHRVDEINAAGGELFYGLKQGDLVTIQDGPFRGYDAIFDARLSGDERVRVLLKLLDSQQIPLEISSRQLQRKKR